MSIVRHHKLDDFDKKFLALMQEAFLYPQGHLKQKQCLTKIVRLIEQSHRLWHEHTPYYEDALQLTWLYLCQNIFEAGTGRQYDPNRSSVITWLNQYLKWRLRGFQISKHQHLARYTSITPSAINKNQDATDNLASPLNAFPILKTIHHWLETDPSGELRSVHIHNRPDITCQALLLRRLPPEQAWENISEDFGLPVSTLSSFYQQQCVPRLRDFSLSNEFLRLGDIETKSEDFVENIDLNKINSSQLSEICDDTQKIIDQLLFDDFLTRYPIIECKNTVNLNEEFNLIIKLINKQQKFILNEYFYGQVGYSYSKILKEVVIVLRTHDFDIKDSHIKYIQMKKSGNFQAKFTLVPKSIGKQQFRVDIYQYDRRIGTYRRTVNIVDSLI